VNQKEHQQPITWPRYRDKCATLKRSTVFNKGHDQGGKLVSGNFFRFSALRVFFAMVFLISIRLAEHCLSNLGDASRGKSHCFASLV